MKIVGIDLAAEPARTAISIVNWLPDAARVEHVAIGATDEDIVRLAFGADKIGIDCALGWPVEFITFLQQQTLLTQTVEQYDGGIGWRRRVAFRETDRRVREVTGRWPLSVATDRLGMTALRCSALLQRVNHAGFSVDRTGAGHIVEVYPSATMRLWGFVFAGYRNSPEIRERLLVDFAHKAPWLELSGFRSILVESCDAFDSLIASLAAAAAARGHVESPPTQLHRQASVEGWIALPNRSIEDLLTG